MKLVIMSDMDTSGIKLTEETNLSHNKHNVIQDGEMCNNCKKTRTRLSRYHKQIFGSGLILIVFLLITVICLAVLLSDCKGSKSCDAYTKNGSVNALGVKDQTVYEPKGRPACN